jgi:hypothetical protein
LIVGAGIPGISPETEIALWLRRVGLVAPTAPIGIMTHHLVHSPAVWDATHHWLNFFRASPEVRFAALSC